MTQRVQSWEVNVVVNGEVILTIGHNHLSGIENIEDYADVVRNCARHLEAFIGMEPSSQVFLLEATTTGGPAIMRLNDGEAAREPVPAEQGERETR